MGTPSPWGSRPVGDPVVRLRRTYRARLRPPIHPLDRPRWTALRATEVARSHGSCPSMARRRLRASFRRMRTFIVGDWTSGNSALAVSHGPRGTPPWTPPDGHRFPDMLFSPSGFRLQVSQATQEPPSEFIPTASGIQRSASRRTPCVRLSPHTALQLARSHAGRPSASRLPPCSPAAHLLPFAHPAEGSRVGRFGALSGWPRFRCAAGDVCLHRWRLGFRQSGFHRITRVSRVPTIRIFWPLSLSHHAAVPLGFHLKVGWVTQKPHSSKLLPAARGIDDQVKRRTRPAQLAAPPRRAIHREPLAAAARGVHHVGRLAV